MHIIGSKTKRKVSSAKRLQITSFVLTAIIAAGVSFGFPLYSDNSECHPSEIQRVGCNHMGIAPNAGVSGTDLCCLLDCHELGPTALAYQMPLPISKVVALANAPLAFSVTPPRSRRELWSHDPAFSPPKTYLRNLALLI